MRRMRLPLFLTFVLRAGPLALALGLTPAEAAKPVLVPNLDEQEKSPEAVYGPKDQDKFDSVDVAQPPQESTDPNRHHEYFYPYRNALTVRAGANQTTKAADDGKTLHYIAGVQYFRIFSNLKVYELGADLVSDGSGELHAAFRHVYSRGKTRPYLKGGVGLRMDPKDRMVGFLQYKNYQIRGAAGLEQFLRERISIRPELEAAYSLNALQFRATLGLVWAW